MSWFSMEKIFCTSPFCSFLKQNMGVGHSALQQAQFSFEEMY